MQTQTDLLIEKHANELNAATEEARSAEQCSNALIEARAKSLNWPLP